ncbi:MAG: phage terminase large subunit [Methylocella sp.]
MTRKKLWYLGDVWRQRVDYPPSRQACRPSPKDGTRGVLWSRTPAPGPRSFRKLRGRVSAIIAVKPEGDKASRMAVASAKFEAGQVLLPERASWLPDLEAELFVFPGSRHDDQCDSISQALLDKNNSFMAWLSPEDWEVVLAKWKIPRPRPPFGRHGGWPS